MPSAVVAGQELGFARGQVLQDLMHVHEVVTTNLYGGEGALIAHTQDDGRAFVYQTGQAAPFFTGADRGQHYEDVLCAHWIALASIRVSLAIAANLTKSHNV